MVMNLDELYFGTIVLFNITVKFASLHIIITIKIDIEDLAYRKYAITDFHSIIWMFIAVIVTNIQEYCCIITEFSN